MFPVTLSSDHNRWIFTQSHNKIIYASYTLSLLPDISINVGILQLFIDEKRYVRITLFIAIHSVRLLRSYEKINNSVINQNIIWYFVACFFKKKTSSKLLVFIFSVCTFQSLSSFPSLWHLKLLGTPPAPLTSGISFSLHSLASETLLSLAGSLISAQTSNVAAATFEAKRHEFIRSFIQQSLLNTYNVPGTDLGAGDTAVNRPDQDAWSHGTFIQMGVIWCDRWQSVVWKEKWARRRGAQSREWLWF